MDDRIRDRRFPEFRCYLAKKDGSQLDISGAIPTWDRYESPGEAADHYFVMVDDDVACRALDEGGFVAVELASNDGTRFMLIDKVCGLWPRVVPIGTKWLYPIIGGVDGDGPELDDTVVQRLEVPDDHTRPPPF